MSTHGVRDFRPKIHFSAPAGWINDPNGLVFYGGKYHLFYQFYPHNTVGGPKHWGHAVSDDLANWEHLPIAIYPDEDGEIYSGSAAADIKNVSGLGEEGKIPLIAYYTCHGKQEEQCVAYSLDGVNFTKYARNPVIPNPGIRDFRDPKVFWNPVRNCWSMVVAAGDRVMFYASADMLSWVKTGEFGTEGNHAGGVWECPDMVPLDYKGKTVWVLIASMTPAEGMPRVGTQYFLGDFDGDKFICTIPFGYAERLDSGWDNYAGVTFNNAAEPVFIGWGTNWQYAANTPTGVYCGNMTGARRLSIAETPAGIRLAMHPLGPKKMPEKSAPVKSEMLLGGETFMLRVNGDGAAGIKLRNAQGQSLKFGVDCDNNLYFDRADAGAKDFDGYFASEEFSVVKAKRYFSGPYTIDFIFDVSFAELFIDGGTRVMSMVCYPDSPYNEIIIEGNAAAEIYML